MEHGSGARISSRFDADSSATRGTNMSTAMNDLDPHSASQAHLPRHSPGQEHDGSASKEDGEDSTAADSKQNTRQQRPPSRGPGIRNLSGRRATLYPKAFRACSFTRDDDGRNGDEQRLNSPNARNRHHEQHEAGKGAGLSPGNRASCGRGQPRRPCCPALALTRDMCTTYSARNPLFRFTPNVPRRVLTVPSTGAGNNGLDNAEFNLIARVNDVLEAPRTSYSVLDLLGQGTFGQVFRCQDHRTKDIVAIKVVKNKPAYRNQALLEIQVARLLNETYDPHDKKNIVRLLDYFQFQNHLCLVFELLSINLYELLKQNQFRGLPLTLIRHFIKQILDALAVLEQANVIHCDLKPENVLLMGKAGEGEEGGRGVGAAGRGGASTGSNRLKVIDFGSACYEGQTMYSYIQSRFYRSPEVLLGLPYDGAIDIWSLGCICVEMFLGLPVFPGVSDHNQICRIVEMTGNLPDFMLENGKETLKFFKKVPISEGDNNDVMRHWKSGAEMAVSPDREDYHEGNGRHSSSRRGGGRASSAGGRGYRHVLKTPEEYASDTNTTVPQLKKYFKHNNIPDIVQSYPLPGAHRRGSASGGGDGSHASHESIAQEKEARRVFTHFVLGLLNPNPWKRWTPRQAASHPFITGQPHSRDLGALTIADDPLISDRYTRQMQALQMKQQKSHHEPERKQAQRLRQQQQSRQQEQQQREQGRGMAIPGASQARSISLAGSAGGSGLTTSGGTPSSMGSHGHYHASPLRHHVRRSSGDSGLIAMQIALTPQRQGTLAGGGGPNGDGHRFGMSRPIDVPIGGRGGVDDGMGGAPHNVLTGLGRGARGGAGFGNGGGQGGGHDLMARSMGYPVRGGAMGTSYPSRSAEDDDDLDAGRAEAYSYGAASFTLGGASGNYLASDFGYALQRPGLRYEPAFKQSPPSAHSSSHIGASSMRFGGLHGGGLGMGLGLTHRASFTSYGQQLSGPRGHERGGRAMSMDQTQTAPLHYHAGTGSSGIGAQLPGVAGRFGPQSLRYSGNVQQASASVSTSTVGPPGYTPLARGGFLAPPTAFQSDAPQGSVPWVRAGRGIGHGGQPLRGSQRAHSTSPLCGRPPAMDVPADTSSEFSHDPNGDDVSINTQDSGTVGDNHNADWGSRLVGVESDDLQGARHSSRQSNAAAARRGHRRNVMGSLGTDPDVVAGDGSTPFTFQLDDGRVQGGTTISSPLNWMSGGGADDPEGVHKRSLNGTSKGVSPGSGVTGGVSSPHDGEGFSIRRVACDEHSSGLVSQQPAQSGSLLSQQLQQYEQQLQGQGQPQGQPQQRSRTPFGSSSGASERSSSSGAQRQHQHRQAQDSYGAMYGRGNLQPQGGCGMDDCLSEHGGGASRGIGGAGSSWVSSGGRALRRRASAGSSEFYFVDTLHQQQQAGGGGGSYVPPPRSPAGTGGDRHPYSGRGHGSAPRGGTPSSFGQQQQQGQGQGHWPIPPRPPRDSSSGGIGGGTGAGPVGWVGAGGVEGSSWGTRSSPLQQQHLPHTPRSMGGGGGRAPGSSWDERGVPGAPDIMHSIHEGNPSPDN